MPIVRLVSPGGKAVWPCETGGGIAVHVVNWYMNKVLHANDVITGISPCPVLGMTGMICRWTLVCKVHAWHTRDTYTQATIIPAWRSRLRVFCTHTTSRCREQLGFKVGWPGVEREHTCPMNMVIQVLLREHDINSWSAAR